VGDVVSESGPQGRISRLSASLQATFVLLARPDVLEEFLMGELEKWGRFSQKLVPVEFVS
jgi:hypothetical protein